MVTTISTVTPFVRSKPKILVTGATGKTGSAVVSQLCELEWPVRALVRTEDARSERLMRWARKWSLPISSIQSRWCAPCRASPAPTSVHPFIHICYKPRWSLLLRRRKRNLKPLLGLHSGWRPLPIHHSPLVSTGWPIISLPCSQILRTP